MKIPHLQNDGTFRPQIRDSLRALVSGNVVNTSVSRDGGYRGAITVEIGAPDELEFEANVDLADWTRFPARIRAVATELRDQDLLGTFIISHENGTLKIDRSAPLESKIFSFYWVNLGDSYKEVADHKFLWAPAYTISKNGSKVVNAGWTHVPNVKKGDIVFCHENGRIIYVAVATTDAYESPRPAERKYDKWKNEGFKIEVELKILDPSIDTGEFKEEFLKLHNDRCSPKLFDVNGKASQQYMISIPPAGGAAILAVLGDVSVLIQDKVAAARSNQKRPRGSERDAIVKARVGQGPFRDRVLKRWDNQCPITKVAMPELLTASHIVSWQISSDEEKVDEFNGLPLSPALDKLFDKGYIAFSDDGAILIHKSIDEVLLTKLGIYPNRKIEGLAREHQFYLRRHREIHGFND